MHLVFVNGWAASSDMLKFFQSYFPAHYEFCILDNLYQFELEDIVAKIDEQMTDNTILMGWSLGGMCALYYASLSLGIKKPKQLILFNASACFIEKNDFTAGVKPEEFDGLKQVIKKEDTKAFLRLFGHLMVADSCKYKEDWRLLRPVFTEDALPTWAALSRGLEYLEQFDLRSLLSTIPQPTIIVLGEKDVLVNASENAGLLNKYENLKVEVVSGMGHFPFGAFSQKLADIVVHNVSPLA